MTAVHPRGVNHVAISTRNIKNQIAFFTDVLGCPLKALYRMHGAEGAWHAFVELNPESYVAFVYHPDNPDTRDYGVTHAGNASAPVTAGALQHISLHVADFAELLGLRDRIRSRGIVVLGPVDHGFCKSIYFAGPEGLTLELTTGEAIDDRAWIDPEIVEINDIGPDELEKYRQPEEFVSGTGPVAQPGNDPAKPHMHYPAEVYEQIIAMPDELVWQMASQTDPPVRLD
ncbi:VOC family protein [Nocardia sp. CA-135398]|uniref:VOC family protein n=1 Tax=Nocardia sp. CA-135398 TaxID=3239977 RepID=UPI003D98842E